MTEDESMQKELDVPTYFNVNTNERQKRLQQEQKENYKMSL
jgi:hypothetical protein